MIYAGIDVAKDKHDCFITNSEGDVLFEPFIILNNADGYGKLFERLMSSSPDMPSIKVELKATGHFSNNPDFAYIYI